MIIDSFSPKELSTIKEICKGYSVSQLKDYIQNYVINKSLQNGHKNIVYMFYTGFGKSRTGTKIIDRFLLKKPDAKIHIVSPSTMLKKKWALENDKIVSYVINSFTMSLSKEETKCNLLIVDEAHHCLNEDSSYFSNLIKTESDYKILLSASLSKKHLEYLRKNSFDYVFELKISDGQFLGLLPDFNVFNLPVDLIFSEKIAYTKYQSVIDKYLDLFSVLTIDYENTEYMVDKLLSGVLLAKGKTSKLLNKEFDSVGWLRYIYNSLKEMNINIKDEKSIIFCAKVLKKALINRESIISNAINKTKVITDLMLSFDRKTLLFTKSKSVSISLEQKLNSISIKTKTYDSDVSENNKKLTMQAFNYDMLKCLICINELKEGLDIANIDFIIRHSFNGSQIDAQQILGRAIRLDENNKEKHSILVNTYVKNFIYQGKEYKSSDISKLEYAYKGIDVTWVESIENIKSIKNNLQEI